MEYRTLHDLQEIFKDTSNCNKNQLIYTIDNIIPKESDIELLYGITTILPGDINGEYFMTKGHIHNIPTAEVYFGLEGEGVVLCGEKTYAINKNHFVYCPPNIPHRVINCSSIPLKFLTICRADAGHNYDVNFSKRFFK